MNGTNTIRKKGTSRGLKYYVRVAQLTPEQLEARRAIQRERSRAWYAQNRKLHLERTNDYRNRNKDHIAARRRERLAIPEVRARRKELDRLWDEKNREKKRDHFRRYRARKLAAAGSHTQEQWLARVEYFGWRCVYCGTRLTVQTLSQDHVIALSKGGTEWPSNLVPACRPCNCGKCDRKKARIRL